MLTATSYAVDADRSVLKMIARSTLHSIESSSRRLRGTIDAAFNDDGSLALDPQPAMRVEVPVDSLVSGNKSLDAQMREMIGSRAFPNIVAEMKELALDGKRGGYDGNGRIEVRGTSHTYPGHLTVARNDARVVIDGETTIDIRDFGIQPPKLLILKMQPEIAIQLHVEASPR